MASTKGLPPSYIVVDNNVLSSLNSFFCDCRACKLAVGNARLTGLTQWMADIISLMRQFSLDGLLHSTDYVADEFRPSGELFAGLRPAQIDNYRRYVREQLATTPVPIHEAPLMRKVPGVRPELVGPTGVSDPDLSLLLLGAQLASTGAQVILITDDQTLLDFTTWVQTRPEARERWAGLRQIQAMRDMVFFDLVHRSCRISTDDMQEMLNYVILLTAKRMAGELHGPEGVPRPSLSPKKALHIISQYQAVQTLVTRSAQAKAANKGVAA